MYIYVMHNTLSANPLQTAIPLTGSEPAIYTQRNTDVGRTGIRWKTPGTPISISFHFLPLHSISFHFLPSARSLQLHGAPHPKPTTASGEKRRKPPAENGPGNGPLSIPAYVLKKKLQEKSYQQKCGIYQQLFSAHFGVMCLRRMWVVDK